jgi:NADPH:quinone reductase-like Zn-dependent oxidoreductase
LTYRDIEKPSITSHTQVIVKIHGAGVNPVDFKLRKGNLANLMKFQFPCVLGIDYSGTIDSVGTSVNHFTVGQQVYGKLAKPPVVERMPNLLD